jgi:hypothetical protein
MLAQFIAAELGPVVEETGPARPRVRKKDTRIRKGRIRAKDTRSGRCRKGRLDLRSIVNRLAHPFLAIMGRDSGTDATGAQNYLYLAAREADDDSTQYIIDKGCPLSTGECLEFIASLPRHKVIVGFKFGHDIGLFMRDWPADKRARLLDPNGKQAYRETTWHGGYGVQYIPGQFFSVARRKPGPDDYAIKGSTRTIHNVNAFFQQPFAKVVETWGDPTADELSAVKYLKTEILHAATLSDAQRKEAMTGCKLLARTMQNFRGMVMTGDGDLGELGVSLLPNQWRGPGHLANAVLQSLGIPKRSELPARDPAFTSAAVSAFSGGRMEISRTGLIDGPVYAYHLNSAYPAAYRRLPCPRHTRWHKLDTPQPQPGALYLARASFDHAPNTRWGTLPAHHPNQLLCYPLAGSGWYWSPEIEAAKAQRGVKVELLEVWQAEQCCSCAPFAAVEEIYAYRKRVEAGDAKRGTPIKLAMNAVYGKFCQRIGNAPFYDPVAAGLITSLIRAELPKAIARDPDAVHMVLTDCVYSARRLDLPITDNLGDWRETKHNSNIFIAQPGFY